MDDMHVVHIGDGFKDIGEEGDYLIFREVLLLSFAFLDQVLKGTPSEELHYYVEYSLGLTEALEQAYVGVSETTQDGSFNQIVLI